MFETVLVADRGLLAVRVIRGCQKMGIKAVACVAAGDEHALHARLADEAIGVGTTSGPLDVDAVVEAAQVAGAQAVHPGGAADADLARAVLAADLAWVGAVPGAPPHPPSAPPWQVTAQRSGRTYLREYAAAPPRLLEPHALVAEDRLLEATTGVDLVERQLLLAAGKPLDDLPPQRGWAVQAALYAEPQTLVPVAVEGWTATESDGVVVDSVLADGAWLTRYDDPLLALITVAGPDRDEALARLRAAVDRITVGQPEAELELLRALLREPVAGSMIG